MARSVGVCLAAVAMALAACAGCSSGPRYEITSMTWGGKDQLRPAEATASGFTPDVYAVVCVRGRVLDEGWVFTGLKVKRNWTASVRDETFEIVPRFKKLESAKPAEFAGYHTFQFDTFLSDFPRIICAGKELGAPDNEPAGSHFRSP